MRFGDMLRSLITRTGPRREAAATISSMLETAIEENKAALIRRNAAVVKVLDDVVLGLHERRSKGRQEDD